MSQLIDPKMAHALRLFSWSRSARLLLLRPTKGEQTVIAAVLSDMDVKLVAPDARCDCDKTCNLMDAMMQEIHTVRTCLL